MGKIGSCLIQQQLMSYAFEDRTWIKDGDFQFHIPSPFETYCSPNMRTLKAVYPHFVQAKRLDKEEENSYSGYLNGEELKLAMEESKNAYEGMRDIQKQLVLVYEALKK